MYLENEDTNCKYIIFSLYGPTNVAVLEKKYSFWLDLELMSKKAQTLFTLAIMIYGNDSMQELEPLLMMKL